MPPLDRTGPWCLLLLIPTGEAKLVYLTGKSQPTKLDKQSDLRLRKNTAQNKLLFPTGRPNQRHLSVMAPPGETVVHGGPSVVPKVGSKVPQGSLKGFQEVPGVMMVTQCVLPSL